MHRHTWKKRSSRKMKKAEAKQMLIHQQKIETHLRKQLLIAGRDGRLKVKVKKKFDDAEPSAQLDGDRKPE